MQAQIFEKIYKDYLSQISGTDFDAVAEKLLIQVEGNEAIIPFFGNSYRVSAKGISDMSGKKPDHSICVVLFKYLLLCPGQEPKEDDWVSYKDFRNAAPFAGAFVNNAERPIAANFSGRLDELRKASQMLGGIPLKTELSYQLSMRFDALPKVPLFLLFNDADDDFPAQCKILFERRAEKYLDMECLAMTGMSLSVYLKRA